MSMRRTQSGLTLVVSLIMLIVLTLLVVSAIRFGNINLKITGNAQTQAEAAAAAQVAVEQVIQAAESGTSLSGMSTANTTVSTGGTSYTVSVTKPSCLMTKNVDTTTLDSSNAFDQLCFNAADAGDLQKLGSAGGGLTSAPAACKDQQWDLAASVSDANSSGAKVSLLQGVALRVSAEVSCP